MSNLIDDIKNHIITYSKRNNKRIPTSANIARRFNISKQKALEIYRKFVDEGFLKRNYAQYKKAEINKPKKDIILLSIKIIMLFIGIGAVSLSIYYTGIWLCEFLPFVLAYLLSLIMVAFSVVAFEVIIILWNNKQHSIVFLFSFLWFIVLLFSMTSTVAGQYNQRIKNEKTEIIQNVGIINKKNLYNIYEEEEKEILISIDRKEKELKPFMSILEGFESIEDIDVNERSQYVYWENYEKIKRINNEIEKLRNDLKIIRENKKIFLENEDEAGVIKETVIEYASFYVWLSGIFGVEARFIEFWLSVFPAIFIDIIAPLSIAISMFLRRKELDG